VTGYSSTPLAKKLGYRPGLSVHLHEAPAHYQKILALDDPKAIAWLKEPVPGVQFIHVFTTEFAELGKLLAVYRQRLAPDGAVWVSWPKKAAKVPTDITEDRVRERALPLGFVDIKVCAVDDVWSGLKLVIRALNIAIPRGNRPPTPPAPPRGRRGGGCRRRVRLRGTPPAWRSRWPRAHAASSPGR
jgi:hypothetical protein